MSPAGVVNKTDAVKTVRTAFLVGAAALLAHLAETLDAVDFGAYGALAVPVLAAVIDLGRRWIRNNR
jgi:hypothetical protein